MAITQWAAFSAQPLVDPAAQQEVLTAVRSHQRVPAAADGSATITEVEVLRALSAARPGTAPGPDGLPLLLYKKCKNVMVPLLARVFSAIGELAHVPTGFLDGVIVGIFKAGDEYAATNYRPITLLNIDYRLLARVLADRLQAVLADAISPTQTAFIRKRRIGNNVITLQLLLHVLPATGAGSEALAVLVDFYKAYDTIDRGFLLAAMEAMGVGPEYRRWVTTLLTNTKASAVMNGYQSQQVQFAAGVRQGCPLSPLLYLFVGEALLRFLKARGVGLTVHGTKITATQFADDTQVFLESAAQLPTFLSAMSRMEAASGQQLNINKTKNC